MTALWAHTAGQAGLPQPPGYCPCCLDRWHRSSSEEPAHASCLAALKQAEAMCYPDPPAEDPA